MSLLSKCGLIFLTSITIMGLSTNETPLMDPSLSARELGLSKAAFTDHHFNHMLRNPATIAKTKGIAIHANEFLGIDYSSITFVHESINTSFGIHYLGSNIDSMKRSVTGKNSNGNPIIKETEDLIPYEYHAISIATAKKIDLVSFGAGLRQKTLVLDNRTTTSIEGIGGITIDFLSHFTFGFSARNIMIEKETENALQSTQPIFSTGLKFAATKRTSLFLALIENKNEVTTHATFHTSVEHYLNDFIPIRIGLDHNRYTFGTGLLLDPFEIDIGWAQSKSDVLPDQITLSFSYALEEKNHLY